MFDISSPLPCDPLLIEASAGTGKTWAIAALTARFIAETDTGIDEVVLITFTERAARELRSRVFERLQHAEAALTAFIDTGDLPGEEVADLLCSRDPQAGRDRVRRALADFDRATVTTIHSFCEAMLKELGVLGDWDTEDTVLADPRTLIRECAIDVYLARYAADPDVPFDPRRALEIAQAACESTLELSSRGSEEVEYCTAVRERFGMRKRTLGVVTFDDMPVRLQQLLASRDVGPEAIAALQRRFRVVMVDEFQDTDPVQWDIVRRAFMAPGRATVLIGDPKQSIYGFRNADLLSYLEAAGSSDRRTLGTNHRSDGAVVAGVCELFGNVQLGHPDIVVTPVTARHAEPRLDMLGAPQKVLIRRADEKDLLDMSLLADVAIDRDLVAMTRRLLADATLVDTDRASTPPQERALRPSDIAVLTRSGKASARVLAALQSAGVPAVAAGQENVLDSPAASDWAQLLRAMAEPRRANVVLAACTDLLGFDLGRVMDAEGQESEAAFLAVHALADAYADGGFAAVLARITASDLHARVIALPGGERRLTDLLHVGELLACAPAQDLQELVDWFGRQREHHSRTVDAADHRMASDADAVRVMTMHAAKGLEFGVVLLPEVSNLTTFSYRPFPFIADGRRQLYVGPRLDRDDETRKDFERQQRDEELRLLYVGLTRARHMAIAWHVHSKRAACGPLTALLARNRDEPVLRDAYGRLPVAPALSPKLISITGFGDAGEPEPVPPAPRSGTLRAATSTRTIDPTWRRTSYSGLTAGLHEAAHATVVDEPDAEIDVQPSPVGEFALPSPMADLPGGAAFGTLVHAALEELDWTPSRLESDAARVVGHLAPRHGLDAAAAEALTAAVVAVCTTPLGPLVDHQSLSDLPVAQRLPELDFDLPLADRGTPATVATLATLLADHLPPDDLLARYPAHLAESAAAEQVLNGFLTGSIDAVLQTPSGRFVVVDYKTNRLPVGPEETLAVGHYRPAAMAAAMISSHYPLQALLYSVALHRYLSWRLPGYRPEQHLGGAGYLFVRGMAGPTTPLVDHHPCGVFSWYPPVPLVLAASDALGGRP